MIFASILVGFVVASLALDVVVVVLPGSFRVNSTVSSLDSSCMANVGAEFQALVCTSSQTWKQLADLNISVYTKTGFVGQFPRLDRPITDIQGQPQSDGLVMTGCSQTGDLESNCGDFTSTGTATVSAGNPASLTGWLGGSVVGCGGMAAIYCVAYNKRPLIWLSAPTVHTWSGVDSLNSQCKSEDFSLPRTYALVCQPGLDWLSALQGLGDGVLGKFDCRTIGDAFVPPFNSTAFLRTVSGSRATAAILTGCTKDFLYRDPATSCTDWSSSAGSGYAAPDALTSWIGNGSTMSCGIVSHIICIRLKEELPTTAPTPLTGTDPSPAPTTATPTATPTTATPTPSLPPATGLETPAPSSLTAPTTRAPTPIGAAGPSAAPSISAVPLTQQPATAPSLDSSNAPSPAPSAASSLSYAPSLAPTMRPTSVPVVVVVTNFTGNVTQNVTVPGNGADVTVVLPASLFQYGNSTASVAIGKGSLGDVVADELLGGDSVVSIDVIVDGEAVNVMDLGIPVDFVIPRPAAACEAQLAAPAICVWWDTRDLRWRTDNCSSTAVSLGDGSPATKCSCNHLTDFAVLLDRATHCPQPPNESYLVFAVIYAAITLYCLGVGGRLQLLREEATRFLRSQHSLIGFAALVRLLSCLCSYGLFGTHLAVEGVLTALPYLIELWIFTRLASTWLGLVQFTMLASDLRWEKIRPWLYGTNIVGSLFVISLFIAFLVELDFTTALVGTIGIAFVYVTLALAFLYYSSRLVTTMSSGSSLKRANSANSLTKKTEGLCSPSAKILFAGRVSAVCFIIQAVSSVLALVLEREAIAAFTRIFLTFNCVALISLLLIYQGAVAKGCRSRRVEDSRRGTELSSLRENASFTR